MGLDQIIGYVIVPLIFFWLGYKIYNHEKEHIDGMVSTVKGWFSRGDTSGGDSSFSPHEYHIEYAK